MKTASFILLAFLGLTLASKEGGSRQARDLFKLYSERVYGKEYDKVQMMYDDNAVTVEKGKEAFFGPAAITKAIKNYHIKLGDGSKTINYNEKMMQLSENFIYYYSDYKTELIDRTIGGTYWQLWKKDTTDSNWRIIHDEFSIDD